MVINVHCYAFILSALKYSILYVAFFIIYTNQCSGNSRDGDKVLSYYVRYSCVNCVIGWLVTLAWSEPAISQGILSSKHGMVHVSLGSRLVLQLHWHYDQSQETQNAS